MNQHNQSTIENLSKAIKYAWEKEQSGVAQFGLAAVPAGIMPAASGWTIPVASGVPTGSAYELARLLDRLQEHIEATSKMSVTLFLDPFASGQLPASPQRKAS
jgi:hypothetical protein